MKNKSDKRVNEFAPLPPNYDQLSYDDKVKCSEAVYKRQLHMSFQYHLGDPELVSGDKAKEIYEDKEE